jgi:hypothetical protein
MSGRLSLSRNKVEQPLHWQSLNGLIDRSFHGVNTDSRSVGDPQTLSVGYLLCLKAQLSPPRCG